jgi:hypothetical protein
MKQVVILLLVALMLNGCNAKDAVQAGAGGIWQANLTGGDGQASGFSFVTEFTVGNTGPITFNSLQFLTYDQNGSQQESCFPLSPQLSDDTGTTDLMYNSANQLINSTVSITVISGGNTLTLTSISVTGTLNTNGKGQITGGLVTGNWAVTGGAGCNGGGNFTMTQEVSNP